MDNKLAQLNSIELVKEPNPARLGSLSNEHNSQLGSTRSNSSTWLVRIVKVVRADVYRVAPVAEVDVNGHGDSRRRWRLHCGGSAGDDTALEGPRGEARRGGHEEGDDEAREATVAGAAQGRRVEIAMQEEEVATVRREEGATAMDW